MKKTRLLRLLLLCGLPCLSFSRQADPFLPDFNKPDTIKSLKLVWNEEFNYEGKPDPASWRYEHGFVRNQELQWYQEANARCSGGVLKIEGRKEEVRNPGDPQNSNLLTLC